MIYKKIIVTFSYFGKLRLNRKLGKHILIDRAIPQFIEYENNFERVVESYKHGIYNNVEIEKIEKIKLWEFWK